MDEKRDEQVFKHVCRLCNKRYPSGKSLGGHMRSHAMASAAYSKSKSKKALTFRAENGVSSVISADNNGYGLRENPRKSWRMVDHTITTTFVTSINQEMVCKICGKGFPSSKALCGHMSCHSNEERSFNRFKDNDEESWASDEEDEEDVIDSFSAVNGCSYNNSSGFELEQEEVALCLMMLSRDSVDTKIGFHFTAESNSDNNSVILEGGSSSNYAAKSSKNDANGSVKMINLVVPKPASKKEVGCEELDNSDSGYFENGSKELESDDSVDGFAGNYGIKRSKVEYGPEFSKRLKKVKIEDDSPREKYKCSICRKGFKTHQALGGHIITHKRDIKNANAYYNGDSENADKKKALMGSKKTKGHCCPFCPKVFKSGQALGGHKRSHTLGCLSQDEANVIKSVDENPSENHRGFIDLNLPAPGEEDGHWQW